MEDVSGVLGGPPCSHLPTPHLQAQLEPLLEGAGGDGVENGVQGTVDGKDEDHHPQNDCP